MEGMLYTLFFFGGAGVVIRVRWGYRSRLLKRELWFEGCVEETGWGLHVNRST